MKKYLVEGLAFLVLAMAVSGALDDYVGTTQWSVDVTEDETGCGGPVKEKTVVVTIKHEGQIAELSSYGHGPARGTFSGFGLTIPTRSIKDGIGMSKLHEFKALFDADCSGFGGEYRWDYTDQYQACSGTTKLKGRRIDGTGCPGETKEQFGAWLKKAREEKADAEKERLYKEMLEKDPANFWANWDMAELKKKQGRYDDYFAHFDKAINNERIFMETKEKLKQAELEKLHLSAFPTKGTSPILRIEEKEVNNWDGGLIYDVRLPKDVNNEKWWWKVWGIFAPDSNKLVNELVGVQEE